MPEETTGGAPERPGAPGGATPPARPAEGATPPQGSGTEAESARDEGTEEEIRDPQALLQAYRAEQERRREAERIARESREALTRREREGMSEQERLQAENEELRGSLSRLTERDRERALREEIADLAPKIGITDPRLAGRLLRSSEIEWDEKTGSPVGVDKALRDLKKEYPLLSVPAGRGGADGGTGTGSAPGSSESINDAIRRRAGRA